MLIELRFQWVVLEIEIFLSQIDDAKIALEETIDAKIETLKTSKLKPVEQLDEAYDQIYAASIGRNDPGRRVVGSSWITLFSGYSALTEISTSRSF